MFENINVSSSQISGLSAPAKGDVTTVKVFT